MPLATVPAKVALGLVRATGYALVPISFTDAFRLESILRHPAADDEEATLERAYTMPALIPPFTYQIDPPVPAEAMPTLGSRLLLVANARLPAVPSQISCDPRGSVRTSASCRGRAGFVTS